jgi:protein phosphatase 2C family protein 2/3
MGQLLSEPVLEKETNYGGNDKVIFAISSMQGWRVSMEDAHIAILSLVEEIEKIKKDKENNNTDNKDEQNSEKGNDEDTYKLENDMSFFGVFDGHSGGVVSKYASKELHKILVNDNDFKSKNYEKALKSAFFKLDDQMQKDAELSNCEAGSTAVVSLITDKSLYIANCGDSRAIISSNGKALALSVDHKPTLPDEKTRIYNSGGFLQSGRVNGQLAVSRSLGDFVYKTNTGIPSEEQTVTANPDILIRNIAEDDEFIVLACDGVWDYMSNEQVIDFIREGISNRLGLSQIAENLLNECASEKDDGSKKPSFDNMTMIIVGFLQGKTKEEYYNMIKERYIKEHPDKQINNPDSEIMEKTSTLKK